MKSVSIISAISVPIELYTKGIMLGPVTAFFYKKNGNLYLVSNWHVFSGRNSQSGQPLMSSGAIPDNIKIKLHGEDIGCFGYGWNLPLLSPDGENLWLQHQQGQNVDLACMKCSTLPPTLKCYTIEDHGESPIAIEIGQDVMIVGYPRGFIAQGIWPIWKRGTLAAEPHIDRVDKLPIYLVDAASREGMSGSPVYLYSTGLTKMEGGDHVMNDRPSVRFIGVYSGRYGDENDMQLGRVWRREVLDEMCLMPIKGDYTLRSNLLP